MVDTGVGFRREGEGRDRIPGGHRRARAAPRARGACDLGRSLPPPAWPGRPPRRRKPCDRRPPDGFARSGVRPVTASKTEFHRRLGNALANDRLRTALRRALPELRERRDARMAEVDWEGLRADLT